MESLIELCDLIAQNPSQFADKLAWICGRCPPIDSVPAGSLRVSRSQLIAVLATARFLFKCSSFDGMRPKPAVLGFFRSIPYSFAQSFWPQSFGIASFFKDFLSYVNKASELSSDFAMDVVEYMGEIVMSAINNVGGDLGL
ncbi:unnamed protein product [Ilex paraguariensis]|uniref:Poly(ADP-ribose) glycohydrolase n=1 Tax=Ilex paraguariensis TaxID=185542 RepID=A0ABC8TUS1_9AQUA